jgi:hypothetical protein
VPLLVLSGDGNPKLLVNVNVPSPPTVFFTISIAAASTVCRLLVKVQVVVAPATTVIAAGVPFVQLAPV